MNSLPFSRKNTRDFYVLPALGKFAQWGLDNYTDFGEGTGMKHYVALAVVMPVVVTLWYKFEKAARI